MIGTLVIQACAVPVCRLCMTLDGAAQVASVTMPANYFHLLRRQIHRILLQLKPKPRRWPT